jgi:hypothetical protein
VHGNPDADSNTYSYTDADPNPHAHADADANADSDANAHTDVHSLERIGRLYGGQHRPAQRRVLPRELLDARQQPGHEQRWRR